MPAPRPLPRSLEPLPGESLPGFLLRLSFRLGLPPAQLAGLTGLAPAGSARTRLPVTLLAGIPEPASRVFAFMTRLDAGQAARLGMSGWRERYPPVTVGPPHASSGRRRLNLRLILAPVTRYCPECLAGDGSAVQESFGGPWLKAWHLPVVFACPAHQRILEHRCPECGRPVRGHRPAAQPLLLPAAIVPGLHPAQCRTVTAPARGRTPPQCCGARLDQPGNPQPASPETIAFQDKILGLLDPAGPAGTLSAGQPAAPPGYFADLQETGLLACATWPAARHLSPSRETAAAIDEHVDSLRRQAADKQRHVPVPATRSLPGTAPADAAASAGLAAIASRVLAGSTDEVREKLRQLIPGPDAKTAAKAWTDWISRPSSPCSGGLREAAGPMLWGFTRSARAPARKRATAIRPRRWGPEHIPAFLPEDWYSRHFTQAGDVSHLFLRRTAPLRLVQIAAGGSLGEAARFLGIADSRTPWQDRIYSGTGKVRTAGKQQPDLDRFEDSLANLALELDDPATPLVSYQHRRRALENWCIDDTAWTALLSGMPPTAGRWQADLGDRKRQLASAFVWVQVTSGEHYFAPRPIEDAQPAGSRERWNIWLETAWHRMHHGPHGPHYAVLKIELAKLATSLTLEIDAAAAQPARSD